jgi:hypothetical protein
MANTEAIMDIDELAKGLSELRYETAYRFENGESFRTMLNEQDLLGIFSALRERGFRLTRDTQQHVEAPPIFGAECKEPESTY